MNRKICTKCQKEKQVSEFSNHQTCKFGVRSVCKICTNKINKKQYKQLPELFINRCNKYKGKFPWLRVWTILNQRCANPKNVSFDTYGKRNIKNNLSKEEIKSLWFRDKAYLLDRPSIDRIDNNGNCRFIELRENARKGDRR